MNPAWLFVIAAIIADVGILYSFRKLISPIQANIEEGKEINMETFQKEQTRFFIRVAVVEAIPILLIVFGFAQIEQYVGTINVLFPLAIIIAVFLFAVIRVFTIRRDSVGFKNEAPESTKNLVNTYVFIGIALLSAIPLVSVVAISLMI
jgi:F0F1-type ATP synthase membrane subunit c/vacuolar-type H+-ATPase subunit K